MCKREPVYVFLLLCVACCTGLNICLGDKCDAPALVHSVQPSTLEVTHDDGTTTTYRVQASHTLRSAHVVVGANSIDDGNRVFVASNKDTTLVVVRHKNTHVQKMHFRNGQVVRQTQRLPTDRLPDEVDTSLPSPTLERRGMVCPASKTTNPTNGRTVLRVGVLHTPQARDLDYYAGSSEAIQLEVATAVVEANVDVLPHSGIAMEIGLCANELLDEQVEGRSTDATLDAFKSSSRVEAVRARNECDVMVLFSSLAGLGNSACGVGFLPGKYSVVAADCFVDNFSFLHELGHNLGACHGFPARMCGAGANAYGDEDHHFRTILAYRAICVEGANCTRIPRFSNAKREFSWQGAPIGNTGSDNAWIINANKHRAASNSC